MNFDETFTCYLILIFWQDMIFVLDWGLKSNKWIYVKHPLFLWTLAAFLRRGRAFKEKGDFELAQADLKIVINKDSAHLAEVPFLFLFVEIVQVMRYQCTSWWVPWMQKLRFALLESKAVEDFLCNPCPLSEKLQDYCLSEFSDYAVWLWAADVEIKITSVRKPEQANPTLIRVQPQVSFLACWITSHVADVIVKLDWV